METIESELLPLLNRGTLITASEMGHHDIYALQPENYWELCRDFLYDGEIRPRFTDHSLDFAPEMTFQQMTDAAVW